MGEKEKLGSMHVYREKGIKVTDFHSAVPDSRKCAPSGILN